MPQASSAHLVRVRFAPSPTGFLHVGGARTALFNWLYARKQGGTFLLRVEDTDRERSTDEHTQVILDGLTWLGLDWDEELVFQGANLAPHQAVADRLLGAGAAYEDEGAIRFRMPPGEIAWDDAVYGHISFQGSDIKDWVILRSDRTPTYNFSVVCDDVAMRISHVMRGDDHISNTPKQIAVYRALGADVPVFAHLPMLHGPDGKKLSKRHGATAVGEYRRLGILPAAMRNFLALLGWNPGDDRELFFSMDELIEAFSLERVQKTPAVFDMTKLEWMNGQYLSRMPPEEIEPIVAPFFEEEGIPITPENHDRMLRIIGVVRERAHTTINIARQAAVRLDRTKIHRTERAEKLIAKDRDGFRTALAAARQRLEPVDPAGWTPDALEATLRGLADERGLGVGKVFQPIRVALTGDTVSEPVNVLLELVGKDESLTRMTAAEQWASAS